MTNPLAPAGGDPVFRLASPADWRALLYALTPVVFAALVNAGTIDHNRASLFAALALAILSPVVAATSVPAADRWRAWMHGVLGAVAAIVVGLNLFTDDQVSPVIAIVSTVAQAVVAFFNTPNTAALAAAGKRGSGLTLPDNPTK